MTAPDPEARTVDRAATVAGVAVALLAAAWLATTLDRVRYGEGADEEHYLAYARQLGAAGPGAYPELFRDYVADESRWRYPNPLRVGYIALSALASKLGGASYATLSRLSLVAYALALLASLFAARRVLGQPRALLVTLLLACSPLWMSLARRAMVDAWATLLAVLCVAAFFEVVRRPDPVRWRVGFMLAFAGAILVKETSVLLALPFAAFLALERYDRGADVPLGVLAPVLVVPLLASALVWIAAAGGVAPVVRVAEIILASPATNPYATLVGQGPWYRYLIDLLLLSPWPTLLAIGAAVTVVLRARAGATDSGLVYQVVVAAGVLVAYSFFTKNLRYVAILELPLRILAVFALWELFRARRAALAAGVCAVAVVLLCVADYRTFDFVFIQNALYDPISVMLLALRRIVPVQ